MTNPIEPISDAARARAVAQRQQRILQLDERIETARLRLSRLRERVVASEQALEQLERALVDEHSQLILTAPPEPEPSPEPEASP